MDKLTAAQQARIERLEQDGYELGHTLGYEDGMETAMLDIAKKMLANGASFEDIKRYTNVDEDEIIANERKPLC